MAAVASALSSNSFYRFDLSQGDRLGMDNSLGPVHLVPNPDFVFPARPIQAHDVSSSPSKRPVSMHLDLTSTQARPRTQRQSVSTLPTFTFNASNTSGMGDQPSPPFPSPTLTIPGTPSKNLGHRRRASEFVGGDSRYGVSTLVSTSPSKLPETLPIADDISTTGSPARRRGHSTLR